MANSSVDKLLQDLARLDFLTYQHALAVAESMKNLGQRLGLSDDQCLEMEFLGAIHDLGKLQTPPAIFKKIQAAKPLTDEERKKLHFKPELLLALVGSAGLSPEVKKAIDHIGSRFDGKGTPPVTGESIHIYTRALTVCDFYDFLGRRRTGNQSGQNMGRQALEVQRSKWFDPVIVDVFLEDKP
jgi:HD-GYP domain-containing protein (c-di-GMP phosphodiesterase class II)